MNYYTRKEIKIIQKKLENLFKHITKKKYYKKTLTNNNEYSFYKYKCEYSFYKYIITI